MQPHRRPHLGYRANAVPQEAAGDEEILDDALVTIVEGSYDIYLPLILRQ